MIRINRKRWIARRPWRTMLGWLIAAVIPLVVVVIVAQTGANIGDTIIFGGSIVVVEVVFLAINKAREPMWIAPTFDTYTEEEKRKV